MDAKEQLQDDVRAGRVSGSVGVLHAVPQQVQSDRAVLVGLGAEVGRGVIEFFEGDPAGSSADELEGAPGPARIKGPYSWAFMRFFALKNRPFLVLERVTSLKFKGN